MTLLQALSAFSVFPSLIAIIKLGIVRHEDFRKFCHTLPSAVGAEARFFFTGKSNPWPERAASRGFGPERIFEQKTSTAHPDLWPLSAREWMGE
jgi:hypothetical protein